MAKGDDMTESKERLRANKKTIEGDSASLAPLKHASSRIVAIIASAGGLTPLQTIIAGIPELVFYFDRHFIQQGNPFGLHQSDMRARPLHLQPICTLVKNRARPAINRPQAVQMSSDDRAKILNDPAIKDVMAFVLEPLHDEIVSIPPEPFRGDRKQHSG